MKFKKLPVPYPYVILGSLLLGLIFGAKTYIRFLYWGETSEYSIEHYALPYIVNFTLWGFLVPVVYFFVQKYPLVQQASNSVKIKAAIASLLVAAFHEAFSNVMWFAPLHFLNIVPFSSKELHFVIGSYPSMLISRLFEYWIIAGILMAFDYYKKFQNKQLELAQMETQLTNAKLSALRLQLQPHFLFNTLNTISSLMEINVKEAQKIVSRFGDLLRTVLDQDKRDTITLREELLFTQNYLEIEKTRFHDRLTIKYQIDENALEAIVPSLILQPLVENAIKHGFSNKTENGKIEVIAYKLPNNKLELRIIDDGKGIKQVKQSLLNNGIGLRNVKERLEQRYKNDFEFKLITPSSEGFEIAITLPFNRMS